MIFKLFVQE